MNTRIEKIVCVVRCESAESLRAATELAERLNHPDSELARTFVGFPGGKEERVFRVGDYFDKIEVVPNGAGGSTSFTLLFHIRESVDVYWKAVLVAALQALRESAPGVAASIVPGSAKT